MSEANEIDVLVACTLPLAALMLGMLVVILSGPRGGKGPSGP